MPPFEVAKAFAFDVVIASMEDHMGMSAAKLIGEDNGDFIAKQLEVKGGGAPTRRAVFKAIKRCGEEGRFPG